MGYQVQGRIEVSIFINEVEYPLDQVNSLNFIHIATTPITKLPTLSFSVTDADNSMAKLGLQDGIPLRISIKALNGSNRVYKFRKFNHTKVFTNGANVYRVNGYWDAPLYWATTAFKGIRGTSDAVLAKIASTCGLKYSGYTTNDSQLWLPQNQNWSSFARSVADNGYASDASCMCLAVGLDGTLLYKNINVEEEAKYRILAYNYDKDSITAVDISLLSDSGLNNARSGYNNMRYKQSLTQDSALTKMDSLQFTRNTRNPELNMVLKNKLSRGPVRFGPIDVGNTHLNYEKASYQNTRYRAMFSQSLEMLTMQPTPVQIFDTVNLSMQKEDSSQDTANSGKYKVSGIALYVQGSNYSEKFILTRHGTNDAQVEG